MRFLRNELFALGLIASAATAATDSTNFKLESWPAEAATVEMQALASLSAGSQSNPSGSSRAADSTDFLYAYMQTRSAGFAGWDDAGGLYVASQLGRSAQLYGVASPGADRRQVTFFPKRMSGCYVNPMASRKNFLYTQDEGGDEQFELRLFDFTTGRSQALTGPGGLQGRSGGKVDDLIWGPPELDGKTFVYTYIPKGSDRWDIRLGTTDGRDTLLLSKPGTWIPLDLRPDGKALLVEKYVSASESELYVLSLADGSLTRLGGGEHASYVDHAVWVKAPGLKRGPTKGGGYAKDGGAVAHGKGGVAADAAPKEAESGWAVCFSSDRDGEFVRLYLTAADGGAPKALSPEAPWDVEWMTPTPDHRALVYALNEDGLSRLFKLDLGSGKSTALPGLPDGIISGVNFRVTEGDSKTPAAQFAFTLIGATFPGDVFSYDLKKGKAVRWTFSETGGLPPGSFVVPQLVRYPTFDSAGNARRTVPAWYYAPPQKTSGSVAAPSSAIRTATPAANPASTTAPAPVLILIHGGPELQARPGFDPFLQYLVGHLGLAVIQPNVRGSTGYGKSYERADDGYLRMHSVRDIGALLDWIKTRPELDANRVAVSGRSYGGFMSLSALIEYGDRLRAGISTVGITHFPSFLAHTSGYRRDLRRVEYGDERDPRMAAFLDSISPLTHVNRLRKPLLLCHGRNDPRVPYSESVHIFEAMKSKNVPTWFLTFADEGHAFHDQDSQLLHNRVMADFLGRNLFAADAAPAAGTKAPAVGTKINAGAKTP